MTTHITNGAGDMMPVYNDPAYDALVKHVKQTIGQRIHEEHAKHARKFDREIKKKAIRKQPQEPLKRDHQRVIERQRAEVEKALQVLADGYAAVLAAVEGVVSATPKAHSDLQESFRSEIEGQQRRVRAVLADDPPSVIYRYSNDQIRKRIEGY